MTVQNTLNTNGKNAADIVKQLPAELRTEQWYCDLHHALFLILLHDARRFVLNGQKALAEYFIDTTTVYWVIHSLMEEEGMAFALIHDETTREHVTLHAQAHVSLTRQWFRTVLDPFKAGAAADEVADGLHRFYEKVVHHIATIDRDTYGEGADRSERSIRREIAHLATSGLPLSPQMAGCETLISLLAPRMKDLLAPRSLAPSWSAPLPELKLTSWSTPLWTGEKGAFRDIVTSHGYGRSHRPFRPTALAA